MWIWVAVAQLFTVFGILDNRKRELLVKLIGDHRGVNLNCDRAKMYLDGKRWQWRWSHQKRDIQELPDSSDHTVKRLGHHLQRQQQLPSQQWRRYKDGEITWEAFQRLASPIRTEFNGLLCEADTAGKIASSASVTNCGRVATIRGRSSKFGEPNRPTTLPKGHFVPR